MAQWETAATVRRNYADMVDAAGEDRWNDATMCGDWTVAQVTGHLASFVDVGFPKFFMNIAKHKFDYDAAADTLAQQHGQQPRAELLASLRDKGGKKSAIPVFPEEMTVLDVVVHTQDVRRALGLDGELDPAHARMALEFITTHRLAKQLADTSQWDGLSLEATDVEWTHGTGPAVRGTAEAILMALTGRPTHDELDGEGVATLRERQA